MPLSPCARGCCWTPYGCARPDECKCHWGDWLKTPPANTTEIIAYRDPTSREAIRNVMKEKGQR